MMSEFDKLKDDAEQYAKDHPEQVQKGEQEAEHAAENKLGIGGQDQGNQQDQQGQGQQGQSGDGGQQNQGQQNQGQ
jgi:hypothetical protein